MLPTAFACIGRSYEEPDEYESSFCPHLSETVYGSHSVLYLHLDDQRNDLDRLDPMIAELEW